MHLTDYSILLILRKFIHEKQCKHDLNSLSIHSFKKQVLYKKTINILLHSPAVTYSEKTAALVQRPNSKSLTGHRVVVQAHQPMMPGGTVQKQYVIMGYSLQLGDLEFGLSPTTSWRMIVQYSSI
jgi:hypothetical protein